MFVSNLDVLCQLRGLARSDLARAAGVSRQAVSIWFARGRCGRVAVRAEHLIRLCRSLGLRMEDLSSPLPDTEELESSLIWDRLWPSVEQLVAEALDGELRALARLVQVYGLMVSARLFGRKVIDRFQRYKGHIHPIRRAECERVWTILSSPASS
ncbi:MAG: helix-turn-helix transcriptional regulator [Deltaproteobacteria bacterium]|nr:helix-turn-helix transcriptional regulator [Deltaproteobacteria bacterium]